MLSPHYYGDTMRLMSKMFLPAGILAIMAISYGVFWYANTDDEAHINAQQSGDSRAKSSSLEQGFVEVPVVQFIETSGSVPQLRYTYNISYPAVSLAAQPLLAKTANEVIKTHVLDNLEAFKKNLDTEEALPGLEAQTSDFALRSRVMLLSPTILSFRFDSAEFIAGSAHPNSQAHVLNYNMETSRIIFTEELFSSTTEGLVFLSEFSREILRARFPDVSAADFDTSVIPGITPTLKNFRSVAIAKNGIVVIFDPYQVASYARGTQEIVVPLDKVIHLLSPQVVNAIKLANKNLRDATEE